LEAGRRPVRVRGVRRPPLEPLELYTEKSGDEIVGQLYSVTDKGGREVSLRPEMPPTLARMVAARANGL
jgi:histidyl-tRNA synthetase